ncbi:MAG: molybdopterin-binding protein [Negativicutes bacterium]|nr:molybdopterin-binding protein [Negativicutes bacterium]
MGDSLVGYHGRRFGRVTRLEEAEAVWRQLWPPTGVETVATVAAGGRVLARDYQACRHHPHYPAAAMDGIAVASAGCQDADEYTPQRLRAQVVNTGQPLPDGCDAVIRAEEVEFLSDGRAEIIAPARPFQNVRQIGEDVAGGDWLAAAGQVLAAADIARLLVGGWAEVEVVRRARIGIVASGPEIVNTVEAGPGEVIDSNTPMIARLVEEWGGQPLIMPPAAGPGDLRRRLDHLPDDLDAVAIIAGTSAGNADFTADIVAGAGEVLVHGVDIRPARPVIIGRVAGKPVLGLPGYPGSCFLAAEIFLRPLCDRRAEPGDRVAVCGQAVHSTPGVNEFVRVVAGYRHRQLTVWPLPRGAGMITPLAEGDGYAVIERHRAGVAAGDGVPLVYCRADRLRWWRRTVFLVGSHDLAVQVLAQVLTSIHLRLAIINRGSHGGLAALSHGYCHLTGVHILDEEDGSYNQNAVRSVLDGKKWKMVRLAEREQGLVVPAGNPLRILGLADLGRPGLRLVNRQRGTGTRQLLDYLGRQAGVDVSSVIGYRHEVGSHTAVAVAVATGAADCGLAIAQAAAAAGCDFLPLAEESYDLVWLDDGEDWWTGQLLDALDSSQFRRRREQLAGYNWQNCGLIREGPVGQ